MRRTVARFMLAIVLVALLVACSVPAADKPASPTYRDGIYQFECAKDGEGYFVKGSLTVTCGKITAIDWAIYDGNRMDKVFDKDYESVFAGNDVYIQQCRDNLTGMAGYAPKLIESQSIDGIDAVSGATWAYNKFIQFTTEALGQAEAK